MNTSQEMPARWATHFPTTREECDAWEPFSQLHELARQVIAVAHTRIEGTWSAYIDAVPGECHRDEMGVVFKRGSKLREDIARVLFPEFDGLRYAR